MADKSTRLILEALGRAATEPEGIALLGSKTDPGLFPATSVARTLADRCKQEGFLEVLRHEVQGKLSREICILTARGKKYLIEQSSSREILEDFLRVLESRQSEVAQLSSQVEHLVGSLKGMQGIIEESLTSASAANRNGHSPEGGPSMNGTLHTHSRTNASMIFDALIAEIKGKLSEWHAASETPQDCPLPDLYRRLEMTSPVSIGQFHDALRQLHDDDLIYLHPWTGPLYALPEPPFALMVGHEIAFYASMR